VTDGTRAPAREIGDDATAEVAERAREELWTAVGTILPYAAGGAILFLEPQSWSVEFSISVAACVLVVLGTAVWQFGTERGRTGDAGRLLSEYAVLRHRDPGVGRRDPADGAAKNFVRWPFLTWLWLLAAVTLPLVVEPWDRPEWAVPGAVLLVIAAGVQLFAREREARAGRRWLADPPGPPRA
jgi:hypothetical protein